MLPYAMARPTLRKLMGAKEPTEYESTLLAQVSMRIEKWAELDKLAIKLMYDFSAEKKKESWGTEAVVNAVVVAFERAGAPNRDRDNLAKSIYTNLWDRQATDGENKGSWDWLDFGLDPWESKTSRYYGAALAAVAVGRSQGLLTDEDRDGMKPKVDLLKDYLKGKFAAQPLHNRLWALWANQELASVLGKNTVLDEQERTKAVEELLKLQRDDGGWSLHSLGKYARKPDKAEAASDGYATGLILHTLLSSGVKKDDARIAKGLQWLIKNQSETGEWKAISVNSEQDPATFKGKFMSDAATAYAVLALGEVGS
jgi:squalene-hopene/tetraprenyl-beta-curcumene cyclase